MPLDQPKSPINFKAGQGSRVMDFRPSQGLASGIKRIGGRNGTSRLGKSPIRTEKGKGLGLISHKY